MPLNRALKQRISITISQDLLLIIDTWSQQQKMISRSAAIEALILEQMEKLKKEKLNQETEAYYLSLSESEKQEREDWTKLSSIQAVSRLSKRSNQ